MRADEICKRDDLYMESLTLRGLPAPKSPNSRKPQTGIILSLAPCLGNSFGSLEWKLKFPITSVSCEAGARPNGGI